MKAFTLIELLVVIAIIGILSAVVLASLNNARDRGGDSAIKSNLTNARAQAELYFYNNNQSYTGVCASGASAGGTEGVYDHVSAAADVIRATVNTTNTVASNSATPAVCHALGDRWASLVQLQSSTTQAFCIDSSPYSGVVQITALSGSDYTCR